MTDYKQVIAIDGPAGAGKSTIAKKVAQMLKYVYIDTGAMYRGVAWEVLQTVKGEITDEAITKVAENIHIELSYDAQGEMEVAVNGKDVSKAIRTPEVTALVSQVAAVGAVRAKMVELQRKMAAAGKVIMDGRDIGTCVLPNADLKIYLTASAEERARRRALQMEAKGFKVDLEQLQKDIIKRDEADMNRKISPLKKADDAILLDTTKMSETEVVDAIITMIKQ